MLRSALIVERGHSAPAVFIMSKTHMKLSEANLSAHRKKRPFWRPQMPGYGFVSAAPVRNRLVSG
jgi:hypothetical protein